MATVPDFNDVKQSLTIQQSIQYRNELISSMDSLAKAASLIPLSARSALASSFEGFKHQKKQYEKFSFQIFSRPSSSKSSSNRNKNNVNNNNNNRINKPIHDNNVIPQYTPPLPNDNNNNNNNNTKQHHGYHSDEEKLHQIHDNDVQSGIFSHHSNNNNKLAPFIDDNDIGIEIGILLFAHLPHPIVFNNLFDIYKSYFAQTLMLNSNLINTINKSQFIQKQETIIHLTNVKLFLNQIKLNKKYQLIRDYFHQHFKVFHPYGIMAQDLPKIFKYFLKIDYNELDQKLRDYIDKQMFDSFHIKNECYLVISGQDKPIIPITESWKSYVLSYKQMLICILTENDNYKYNNRELKKRFGKYFGQNLDLNSEYIYGLCNKICDVNLLKNEKLYQISMLVKNKNHAWTSWWNDQGPKRLITGDNDDNDRNNNDNNNRNHFNNQTKDINDNNNDNNNNNNKFNNHFSNQAKDNSDNNNNNNQQNDNYQNNDKTQNSFNNNNNKNTNNSFDNFTDNNTNNNNNNNNNTNGNTYSSNDNPATYSQQGSFNNNNNNNNNSSYNNYSGSNRFRSDPACLLFASGFPQNGEVSNILSEIQQQENVIFTNYYPPKLRNSVQGPNAFLKGPLKCQTVEMAQKLIAKRLVTLNSDPSITIAVRQYRVWKPRNTADYGQFGYHGGNYNGRGRGRGRGRGYTAGGYDNRYSQNRNNYNNSSGQGTYFSGPRNYQ